MSQISYITEEGLKKLREELIQLESVERPRISKQIAEARDKGDLSENAEYDAAKDAQGMLEMRIGKLKDVISNCRIIDETRLNTSKVRLLNKVKVKNLKNNAITTYMIVSESEANLKEGKISIATPIGIGLLGKKKGDKVEIKVPSGIVTLQIMEISL
ncbi:MAG: transcription elongation factor GreA [Marinilabiliaceae bacterium]|nr:transcription elongation factor GreA [Marinilabiliaceae bacterium]